MRWARRIGDALIGDGVRDVRCLGGFVLVDVVIEPSDGFATRVQTALEAADDRRTIAVLRDVLLPGPDQLHRRRRDRLGNARGLQGVVVARAAAKGAAEIGVVDRYFVGVEGDGVGHRSTQTQGVLGASPHVANAVAQPDRAVQGFHCRVRQIGHAVLGGNSLLCTGKRRVDIAGRDIDFGTVRFRDRESRENCANMASWSI